MVKEIVYIKMYDDICIVNCKFWFYNHGKTDTVKIGFPSVIFDQDAPGHFPINSFKSSVNNIATDINIHRENVKLFHENDGSEDAFEGGEVVYEEPVDTTFQDTTSYTEWFVKDVVFKGYDTTVIEDTYWSEWGASSGDNFMDKTFTYFIGSGATWFNNITNGTIIFDHSEYASNISINSLSYKSQNTKLTQTNNFTVFKFNSLKPDTNQEFSIMFYDWDNIGFDYFESNYEDINFKEFLKNNNFGIKEQVLIKNEILAKHGYIFSDPTIQNYYNQFKWYKKDKKFKVKNLDNATYRLLQTHCKVNPETVKEIYIDKMKEMGREKLIEREFKAIPNIFEIDKNSE